MTKCSRDQLNILQRSHVEQGQIALVLVQLHSRTKKKVMFEFELNFL